MVKLIYKILFLPLIFIEKILFNDKSILKKLLSLIVPSILLLVWGFIWCLAVLFFLALFGIWYNTAGEYISIVTIIWSTIFIVIPVIKKSKKMNILYGLSLIIVILLAIQMFAFRFSIIGGSVKELGIKDGQNIIVNLLYPKNDYKKGDLVTYTYNGVSRIDVIKDIDNNQVVFKDKKIILKDLTGKVIYSF